MEAKMKGLITVLALASVSATAYAAALPDRAMNRTVGHVKRLERLNKFGLRDRIGGPFKLSGTSCGEPGGDSAAAGAPTKCRWTATAVLTTDGGSAFGERMRCTVEIRLRENARHHVRWRRHVEACAKQQWGKP